MRRILSTLALALVVLGLVAAPAAAKGPTHMLLMGVSATGLTGDEVLELADPRASEIAVLLDDLGEKYTGREYEDWHEVHVSWTMHAFEIWRSDIVFVDGKGAAVVMTLRSMVEGEGFSTDWRRVENGEALTEAFEELGLLGQPPTADSSMGKDAESSAATTSGPASSSDSSSGQVVETHGSSDGSSTGAWRWALPALLAGLLLGAVGTGAVRRRTPQAVAQRLASS
jgi:hypothetical protein